MATIRTPGTKPAADSSDRKAKARLLGAALLGAVIAVFAALNSQSVRVHWIVTTTNAPLIVVILVCALIGVAIGFMLARRAGSSDNAK